jgi:hypothetical protein
MKLTENTSSYRKWLFAVVAIASSSIALGQIPVPSAYHPGQEIRISVTLNGVDASKVKAVAANLSIPGVSKDQAGFAISLFTQESKQVGPNTFEVTFRIPSNLASGQYRLDQIRALTGEAPQLTVFYGSPDDFPNVTFRIENPERFIRPGITNIKELSKP